MFVLDKVRIQYKSATVLLVMSVRPLVFGRGLDKEVIIVVIRFLVPKLMCVQGSISLNFYFRYE